MFLFATTILVTFLILWLKHLNRDYNLICLARRIKTVDGTPLEKSAPIACGFLGNNFDLSSYSLEQTFDYLRQFAKKYERNYILYFFLCPVYNIIDAENAELVLSDNRLLKKGIAYTLLQPFLRTGLLTSTDKKWHNRRRLLTPAFHFNILTQFIKIFKRESVKFINILNGKLSDGALEAEISLSELIPRFTLNSICETALGVSLDDSLDGDNYRQHITEVEEMLVKRIQNPLLAGFDMLYSALNGGKSYLKFIDKLHKFSSDIIEKRRHLLEKELQDKDYENNAEENDLIYRKQRYFMLDHMLRAEKEGLIDHVGICEEVDTFMFEGFDTVSMNLIFTLMNLALFPDMQEKCVQEIQQHISCNLDDLDFLQLNNLKYLDCFIKESQRLYPSVPIIVRECTSDLALPNNLLLPKGTQINIHIFDIHRNPKYYTNPEEFRPERFMLAESEKRHPFAFIPFSAGQRNCIGQKFAMLEIKTVIVHILKHFKLEAITQPDSFKFSAGLLIRTKTNIKIKIMKR